MRAAVAALPFSGAPFTAAPYTAAAAAAAATATTAADAAAAAAFATSAAADAAAAADAYTAAADADAAIWSSVTADANWLVDSKSTDSAAEALLARPLWLIDRPDWFDAAWQVAARELSADGKRTDPWIGWFDRRIAGHATGFALPPDADRAVQIKIAEQRGDFWSRYSAKINADIQAWIDDAVSPKIPPQHPNDLQTIARDGRVARLIVPPAPVGADQELRRRAAWDAIRTAVDDWLADGPTNSPRLDRSMMRIAAAIGDSFDAVNPVGLGIHAETLQAMAVRADDILMAERAAGLVGLNMAIARFLLQFVEWTDFLGDAHVRPNVSPEVLASAIVISDAIAQSDVAEPEVVAALTEQAVDARDEAAAHDPDVPPTAAHRQRFIVGLGNTLATWGEIALEYIRPTARKGGTIAGKAAKAGLDRFGKGVGTGMEKAGEAAVLSLFGLAGHELLLLAGQTPGLAWLVSLVTLFKKNMADKKDASDKDAPDTDALDRDGDEK